MMPDKIFLNKRMLRRGMLYPAQYPADVPEFEYIRKDMVINAIKLAYGKMSMNPFDCQEAFEELLDKLN